MESPLHLLLGQNHLCICGALSIFQLNFLPHCQDEEAEGKKRRRNSKLDNSDDSDFDDIRHIHGAKAALREGAGSVRYAATEGGRSRGGRSTAGASVGGHSLGARTSATARGGGAQHSGDR